MKFISEYEKEVENKHWLYINKNGDEIDNDIDRVYAKVLIGNDNKKQQYFIKTYQGQIFDPKGMYNKREFMMETKMKKVSKNTFDFYVTYLQTDNSIYLTRANRSFNNG